MGTISKDDDFCRLRKYYTRVSLQPSTRRVHCLVPVEHLMFPLVSLSSGKILLFPQARELFRFIMTPKISRPQQRNGWRSSYRYVAVQENLIVSACYNMAPSRQILGPSLSRSVAVNTPSYTLCQPAQHIRLYQQIYCITVNQGIPHLAVWQQMPRLTLYRQIHHNTMSRCPRSLRKFLILTIGKKEPENSLSQ